MCRWQVVSRWRYIRRQSSFALVRTTLFTTSLYRRQSAIWGNCSVWFCQEIVTDSHVSRRGWDKLEGLGMHVKCWYFGYYPKYQHFTFCSFTVLNKLKASQLSKVGLLTIEHQHSKKLTPWAEATWTKNTWKCKLFAKVCSQKMFKLSTICMDTCLETLSPLVSCSVDNVLL